MTWTILQADARQIPLKDNSVQCVVTSPPYWGLRDYGAVGQIGLEKTPQEYVEKIVAVFREVWRVLRDDGTCWVNLGDSYNANQGAGFNAHSKTRPHLSGEGIGQKRIDEANRNTVMRVDGLKPKNLVGVPWRVAFALQADGWYLRSDIIWAKPNPMPESVTDRPTKAHEYIFLLSKNERYFFDQDAVRETITSLFSIARNQSTPRNFGISNDDNGHRNDRGRFAEVSTEAGRNIRSVWTIATQPYAEAHFATFPEELAERCIKAGTSEKGCCAKCGKARERVTETTRTKDPTRHTGRAAVGCDDRMDGDWPRMISESITLGWQPGCSCDAPTVPCVVLDPFAGAGTTCLVADKLNRKGIGLELKNDYCRMAERRCYDDAPLLVGV